MSSKLLEPNLLNEYFKKYIFIPPKVKDSFLHLFLKRSKTFLTPCIYSPKKLANYHEWPHFDIEQIVEIRYFVSCTLTWWHKASCIHLWYIALKKYIEWSEDHFAGVQTIFVLCMYCLVKLLSRRLRFVYASSCLTWEATVSLCSIDWLWMPRCINRHKAQPDHYWITIIRNLNWVGEKVSDDGSKGCRESLLGTETEK